MQNKSTIGYLTKQYRIILKKCFYLNLAAMMVAGTICVSSANAADLTVADGATETKNLTDDEIYENITVETGGTLNITGNASDPEAYKIGTTEKASETTDITINGTLNITNSNLESGNDMDSAANNSNMLLDGATIDLTNSSMEANGDITITDTTIEARTTLPNNQFGLWADKDITISGANTDVTLNNGTYIAATENITISDATVSIDGDSFIGSYDSDLPLNVTINSGDFTLTNNGEISTDGGILTIAGGTFNASNRSGMLGKTTKISGVDTAITLDDGWTTGYESFTFADGVINLSNNSGIGAEGISTSSSVNDIITYPGGAVNLNSGTINVKTGLNNIMGATINSSATINIDSGATLRTVASYTENYVTGDFTLGDSSTITNKGTINLSGTLNSNVKNDISNPTAGVINFNSSTAKIDGRVDGANVAFNENITLSNAITETSERDINDEHGSVIGTSHEHYLGDISVADGKTLTIDERVYVDSFDFSEGNIVIKNNATGLSTDSSNDPRRVSLISLYGDITVSGGKISLSDNADFGTYNGKLTISGGEISSKTSFYESLDVIGGVIEMTAGKVNLDGNKMESHGNFSMTGGEFNLISETDFSSILGHDGNIDIAGSAVINMDSKNGGVTTAYSTIEGFRAEDAANEANVATSYIKIAGDAVINVKNNTKAIISTDKREAEILGNAILNVEEGSLLTGGKYVTDDSSINYSDYTTFFDGDRLTVKMSENAVLNLKGTLDAHLNLAGGSLNLQTSSKFTAGNKITVDVTKTGNISTLNNEINDTVELPNLVLNGDLNLDFDANLATGASDKFSFASETGDGSIIIDDVNLLAGLANGATSKDITIFTGNNLSSLTVDVDSASISSGSYKLAYNNGKLTFSEATYDTLQEGYNANGTRSYAMTGNETLTGAMSGSSFTINGNGNEILAGVDDLSLTDTQTLTLNNVTANGNIVGTGAIKAGDTVNLIGDITAKSLHGNLGSSVVFEGDVNVDTISSDSEIVYESNGEPDNDYKGLIFKGDVTANNLTGKEASIDFESSGKTIDIDEVDVKFARFVYTGIDPIASRTTFTGNIDSLLGIHIEATDIIGDVNTGLVVGAKGNSSIDGNLTADEIVLYSREKTNFTFKGNNQTIGANVFNIDRTDVSQGDTDSGDDAFVISGSGNTFTGDFGKSGSLYFTDPTDNFTAIPEIVVNGATTFTGDIYADKVSGSADITLAGTNQVVDTDLNGTDFTGTLNFKSDSASVDGDMTDMDIAFLANATLSNALKGANNSFTTFDIANNSVVTYDKDITIGDLNVADGGVLAIGTNDVAGITTANFADGSTLQFQVSGKDAADYGSFTASTINITDGANLELILDTGALAKDEKATFDILDGTTTGSFTLSTNARYEFVDNNDGTFDITGKATAADIVGDAGGDDNNAGTATAWDKALPADAPQSAKDVLDKLNELSQRVQDSKKYIEALTSLAPEANGANSSNVVEGAKQIFRAIANRFNGGGVSKQNLPSGDQVLGESALWAQGLINSAELDVANGFESDTYGIAFGYENNVNEMVKLGFGYAYTNSEIDATGRTTDADTNTIIAYGEYKPSDWYVNGILSYSFGAYDENKDVGGVNVNADYDVNALALQAMTGYNFDNQGFVITPEAGLRYVRIEQDSYTDTAAQTIASKSDDVLTGVIGAKVSKAITLDNGMTLTPEAKIALTYDITEADSNTVVSLANGSSYTSNTEPLERFGQEIGFGLTASINENVDVNVGYEGKFRKDFSDHTGMLNIRYNF